MGDIYAKLKLPPIHKFKTFNKQEGPYHKIFNWVAKQFGGVPEGLNINVSAVWLHCDDFDKVDELVKIWAKKNNPYLRGKSLDSALAFYRLELSPASFDKEDVIEKKIEPGYAYIRGDLFVKREKF